MRTSTVRGHGGIGDLAADRSRETDQEEVEMKAFKKHMRSIGPDLGLVPSEPYDAGYILGQRHGWRAALEWYRDTMDEIEAHDLPLHGREVIEQELEDSE